MTNKEILERAISKAIDGGWNFHGILPGKYEGIDLSNDVISGLPTITMQTIYKGRVWGIGAVPLFAVLYEHDFAKALWGEEHHGQEDYYSSKYNECSGMENLACWEYHLKQMVISKDPIKYLGANI